MNLFSVCLCAPLMNEALLYTSLLPLQTHLQAAKRERSSLVTLNMSVTCGVNEMCYTNFPITLRHIIHIALLRPQTTKHLVTKSVGRHKDEIMASVLFELIPMGKSEQSAHKYRSGVLYF